MAFACARVGHPQACAARADTRGARRVQPRARAAGVGDVESEGDGGSTPPAAAAAGVGISLNAREPRVGEYSRVASTPEYSLAADARARAEARLAERRADAEATKHKPNAMRRQKRQRRRERMEAAETRRQRQRERRAKAAEKRGAAPLARLETPGEVRFHLGYAGTPLEAVRLASTRLHLDNVGTGLAYAVSEAGANAGTAAARQQERLALVSTENFRAATRRLIDAGAQAPASELASAAKAHLLAGERVGLRYADDLQELAAAAADSLGGPYSVSLSEEALANLLYVFAKLRIDCPRLYATAAEKIAMQGASELRPEALSAALWALATMGNNDARGDEGHTDTEGGQDELVPLLQVLSYHWSDSPGEGALSLENYGLSELASCGWALVVADEHNSPAFGALWDRMCGLEPVVWASAKKRELQQVWQMLTALDTVGGEYGAELCSRLPPVALQGARAAFDASDVTVSSAAKEVQLALERLGERVELESLLATPTGVGGLRADMLVLPRPSVQGESEPAVAVEVDGPSHFTADGSRETGPTRLTTRVMSAMGYRVVRVGWTELMSMPTRGDQVEALKRKLAAVRAGK